ncbi:MAG: iron complex outerrane recepter protein [Verrucomicrobiota bacterium]
MILFSCLAGYSFLAASLFGQDDASEAQPTPTLKASATPAEADRVIVTGSHIPTAEEVGPNPVLDITREQIENSGERTAAEIIRQLPQSGPEGVPPANNAFGMFGPPGTGSIALRGFDASSTLVLVDGRRLAPFPLGAPPSFSVSFVDLNSIPADAMENVEVLLDSASAIYGADAVAGVVNMKFRRDYKGAEVSTSYGNTLDKDSGEETESLIFGTADNETNITGVVDYYHRNGIFDHDRGYSQKPPIFGLSTNSSPWNLQLFRAAVLAAGVPASQLPSGAVFAATSLLRTSSLEQDTKTVLWD